MSETDAPMVEVQSDWCPRCGALAEANIGKPWERPDGTWLEWVVLHPHTHGRTQKSTCRAKGFARRATEKAKRS